MTEQKASHARMMMRKAVKVIHKGIMMLVIVMLTGELWKNLVI